MQKSQCRLGSEVGQFRGSGDEGGSDFIGDSSFGGDIRSLLMVQLVCLSGIILSDGTFPTQPSSISALTRLTRCAISSFLRKILHGDLHQFRYLATFAQTMNNLLGPISLLVNIQERRIELSVNLKSIDRGK
jgi:hypothetical protein